MLSLTLCSPIDCSPPCSSVHGIFQAVILEQIAILSSGDLPDSGIEPRSLESPALAGRFFTTSAAWGAHSMICSSAETRTGAACGLDHQLLIAKFRLKLKKVGKTIRQFRYDLNQINYDYTVEVTNRFKRLDLVDRLPEELWVKACNIVQEAVTKTISKQKKMQEDKVVV